MDTDNAHVQLDFLNGLFDGDDFTEIQSAILAKLLKSRKTVQQERGASSSAKGPEDAALTQVRANANLDADAVMSKIVNEPAAMQFTKPKRSKLSKESKSSKENGECANQATSKGASKGANKGLSAQMGDGAAAVQPMVR